MIPNPDKHWGLPSLYLAILLLALNGLFAKLIPLNATSIIQLRSLVAIFSLGGFMLLRKRPLRLANRGNYLGTVLLGILLGLHWISFYFAMQVSTVAVGMLAMFTFPVITILLEPLFSSQRLRRSDLLAGLLVLIGLAIMVGRDLTDIEQPVTLGVISGVISAVLFSVRNLLQKYRFAATGSDALMFYQVLAISLLLAPLVDWPRVQVLAPLSITLIILLGLFSTATAHTLLSYSLKQLSAKSVALIQCCQPLVAALLAWGVLGEKPGLQVVCGGVLILSVAVFESMPQKGR